MAFEIGEGPEQAVDLLGGVVGVDLNAKQALCQADGRTPLTQTLAWDRIRRLPRRAIAVITPSADPEWVRLLQAVRGRRSTLIVFYLDVASFGGPDQNPSFDLGQDVDLYVVRKGDDFARLVRTRDAIRIA